MQNIDEIYKQYAETVYKYIFCLSGDKNLSEEIMQETFVIAIKELEKFRGDCKISVWLCQIAKHLWYKELKKLKDKKIIDIEDAKDLQTNDDIEEIIIRKEDKLKILKDMQNLDKATKEVMYLRMFGELSFSEIAEVLGKTANWARVTFYRGKEKLREVSKNEKRM